MGVSWISLSSGTGDFNLNDLKFTSDQSAVAVGTAGVILTTTDAGSHWVRVPSGSEKSLNSISFSDPLNGCVAGDSGTVLRTGDGGRTWNTQITGAEVSLKGICHSDPVTVTAVGANGIILHTTDRGLNWSIQSSPTTTTLRAIHSPQFGTLVAVGDRTIIRSEDGGIHWTQTGYSSGPLYAVTFVSPDTGIAVGSELTTMRTKDGGRTWRTRFGHETAIELHGVSCIDSQTGITVGSNGSIFRFDREYLIEQESGTRTTLNAVVLSSSDVGTIVGLGGTILRTTTGGVTWIEEPKSTPSLFHLAQNYPNPVTTSTTIPFSITKPEHVRLSVCDMLGREVAVLVDEVRWAGDYSIDFNTAGLRAGIYFTVLRSGSGIETKKMLVVNPTMRSQE